VTPTGFDQRRHRVSGNARRNRPPRKERIAFESYIYEKGDVGERFTAAFEAAARRGVRVRMVLDSVGSGTLSATSNGD
jgi:hypothetical protein